MTQIDMSFKHLLEGQQKRSLEDFICFGLIFSNQTFLKFDLIKNLTG